MYCSREVCKLGSHLFEPNLVAEKNSGTWKLRRVQLITPVLPTFHHFRLLSKNRLFRNEPPCEFWQPAWPSDLCTLPVGGTHLSSITSLQPLLSTKQLRSAPWTSSHLQLLWLWPCPGLRQIWEEMSKRCLLWKGRFWPAPLPTGSRKISLENVEKNLFILQEEKKMNDVKE